MLAHLHPDGRAAVLNLDPQRTAASVAEFASADAEAWLALYRSWMAIGDRLIDAIMRPFPPVRGGAGLLRRARLAGGRRLGLLLIWRCRRLVEGSCGGSRLR